MASSVLLSSLSTSSSLSLSMSALLLFLAAMCMCCCRRLCFWNVVVVGFFLDDQLVLSCRGAYEAAMASCKGQEEVLLRSRKCKLGVTHYYF